MKHTQAQNSAQGPGPSHRWIHTFLFGIIIVMLLLGLSDLSDILRILNRIVLYELLAAFLATVFSFLLITLSYKELFRYLNYSVRFGELLTVTVMSTIINYFIATAGASGYALRAVLLKKREIPATITFSVSLIQGVLTNITVLILFLVNFSIFLTQQTLSSAQLTIIILPILFLTAFIVLILFLFFHRTTSEFIMITILRCLEWVQRRLKKEKASWTEGFNNFKRHFHEASDLYRSKVLKLWLPTIQILFDWIFSMACLYFCFQAVRCPIGWITISTVYFVGIFLSFVFIATGGIGVMEGGMAFVFYKFGVDWEIALVAVLLYRFIYYLLPMLLIIPSYILYLRTPPGGPRR